MRISFYFFVLFFLFSACSVEKRTFNKGYFIQWNNSKLNKNVPEAELSNIREIESSKTPFISASLATEKNDFIFEAEQKSQIPTIQGQTVIKSSKKSQKIELCDLITFTNGNDLEAKVIEITQSEIKYKNCNNLDGPLVTVSKSRVFSIQYANGTREVITDVYANNSADSDFDFEAQTDKSQLIALSLCILVGIIGIHRFYLGYIGIGVLYLLTFGFCGLGVLVDLILLLTGNLTPKNGRFKDTL